MTPQRGWPYNRPVNSPLHGVEHYENFPVASWLMPARLRPAVIAIYRFARHADDLADEGDAPAPERLAALAALRADLDRARRGEPPRLALVAGLVPHVQAHRLPWSAFEDLLSAFEQDVTVHRHANVDSLRDYCRRSAEPVGHLILALAGRADETSMAQSNAICTALQLINFLQDLAIDQARDRLYLPLDSLARHGLGPKDVAQATRQQRAPEPLRACIAGEAARARALLAAGRPLPARVGGRIGWELRAIVAGGERILDKLAANGHDPFAARPALSRADALPLAWHMVRQALGAHRTASAPTASGQAQPLP